MAPPRRATTWAIAAAALVAAIAGVASWQLVQRHDDDRKAEADRQAAIAALFATRFTDADEAPHALADYRGKLLVVNFWATWCGPCKAEMPDLQKVQDDYGARGVEIVGIAIDRAEAVRDFRHDNPIRYPLLIGGVGGATLARGLGDGEGALPYTAVFDRSGGLIEQHLGALNLADLRRLLDDRLRS